MLTGTNFVLFCFQIHCAWGENLSNVESFLVGVVRENARLLQWLAFFGQLNAKGLFLV